MTNAVLRPAALLFGLTAAACSSSQTPSAASGPDASLPEASAPYVDPYAAECVEAGLPPNVIECTGLYANLATKEIAPGIVAYAPAVPLWADFAEKQRWIYLPPGTTIDTTDPNEWVFPVGTKVWKQFSRDGILVETRLFQKTEPNYWVYTTYAWDADAGSATVSGGGNIPWGTDGGIYHIPTPDECNECHRGRTDHLMGFEQVSLGLDGATGLPLSELVAKNLLSPPPSSTTLTIGDDGTGMAATSMAWLHINCGVSCHNENGNSTAFGSGMNLRLDPTLLDGGPSTSFDTRTTTLDQTANNPMWSGQTRIVPGDAAHSLLVTLITNRGTDNPAANQMPPIATYIVDTPDSQNVIHWINAMPPVVPGAPEGGPPDAGSPDGG
jgi:hypothetical protein